MGWRFHSYDRCAGEHRDQLCFSDTRNFNSYPTSVPFTLVCRLGYLYAWTFRPVRYTRTTQLIQHRIYDHAVSNRAIASVGGLSEERWWGNCGIGRLMPLGRPSKGDSPLHHVNSSLAAAEMCIFTTASQQTLYEGSGSCSVLAPQISGVSMYLSQIRSDYVAYSWNEFGSYIMRLSATNKGTDVLCSYRKSQALVVHGW